MKKTINSVRTLSNRLRRNAVSAIRTVSGYCRSIRTTVAPSIFKRPARCVIAQNSGEGFVDTALKILMAVVIGALILAGLYALFGDTILPTLTRRITELFNYAG